MVRLARPVALSALALLLIVPAVSAGTLSFPLHLSAGDVRVETRDGLTAVRVDAPDYALLQESGQPVLPYRIVGVLLPQGDHVASFRVMAGADRVIADADRIERSGELLSEDGRAGRGGAMATSGAGAVPAEGVRLLSTGTLHGYTIASFAVFPVRVEDGRVVASEDVTLEVRTAPAPLQRIARLERSSPGVRERAKRELGAIVINPTDAAGYLFEEKPVAKRPGGFQPTAFPSLEGSAVEYVIVTPDSLAATYQVLADWKTAKGVPTVVRTTEWIAAHYRNGSDIQETIRNFVIDAYSKWGITYLLLGGDTGEIPPRMAYSTFYDGGQLLAVDMYFGCLDGDWNADHDDVFGETPADNADLYAEVYVGRMPSESVADATVMINKVISYETPAVASFTKRILLLGEVLFPVGWAPPQPITFNGADLTETVRNLYLTSPNLNITRMYETEELFPGSVDENRVAVLDSLDNGFNHVVHVGHGYRFNMSVGDVSIVNADVDALTNGNKLACLYFLNCTGAEYTYSCIAEHFLRNPNGGAVSVIGANHSAFPNASQYYMNEYYRLLFRPVNPVLHAGEVFARSRLPRTPLALAGDYIDRWTHYIYTLLAEPEMPMWTGPVTPLTLAHVPTVAQGTNSITVTVTDGVSPVDSALVCLSKNDEDYEVGLTDALGQVTLSFRAETAGTISVVATAHNHARKSGSITVTNALPYVKLDNMTVDDDNAGGTSGNSNGVIDGGETVDVAFTLRNSGLLSTGNVTITLRTSDPALTLIDSTATGGVIAPGGTVVTFGGCRVAFDANTPDEHPVPIVMVIKNDGVETWREEFKKLIHQPGMGLVKLRIDDTGTGNGNGVVEAGEQFKLFYKLKNFGTGAFPGGTVTLTDLDNGFTFVDSIDTYPAAASLAEVENSPGLIMIEPSVATGHRLAVAIVDTEGRATNDIVELRAPFAPTALVIDPSLGPDKLRVTWTKSVSADASRYNLYRALATGGPYTLANPDPVASTFYVNDGLNPNTIYYFKATAVDTSGNESALSSAYSGSTNPPQLAGWPIAMQVETNSSPAVGDIDGDGQLDIVACADRVYAWHANGIEMIDGDGNPQTWGLLSPLGSSFVSHPALAPIDGSGGLDIVCASRDTKEVYVFNYHGQVVSGWPRTLENNVRSGLVVGDITGDGLNEIIAVDEKGVIYVWRTNGTELIDGDANPATQGVFYRMPVCTFNYSTPAIGNFDTDTKLELVVGSQSDRVYVFNGDGTIVAGWPYVLTSDIAGSPALGDVNADGKLDIVVYEMNGNFRVLDRNAAQLVFQFFQNTLFFGPSPVLANVTGDAKLEMFVPAKNGRVYGIDSVGNFLPGWPVFYNTTGGYTESSPVIADVDGNGSPDIVIGDESHYIRAFSVAGQPLAGFPLFTDDAMRGVPTVSDVDQDGDVDLVAAGWDKNVYVWDFSGTWNAANAPWPRFHADLYNTGRLGFVVPTPVEGARFTYAVSDDQVILDWYVPVEAGRVFGVERAEVSGETVGSFQRIVTRVESGPEGRVHVSDGRVEMGSKYIYRLTGESGVVDETMGVYVPVSRVALGQNFPNPFNPVTKIEYWVPEGSPGSKAGVNLVVYDVRGARVRTLVTGTKAPGRYVAQWDGRNDAGSPVSSGIYFYRMTSGNFSAVRKMVLLK